MADEFKHVEVGSSLSQSEYESVDQHILDAQEVGDLIVAETATSLKRLPSSIGLLYASGDGVEPTYVVNLPDTISVPAVTLPMSNLDPTAPTNDASSGSSAYISREDHDHGNLSDIDPVPTGETAGPGDGAEAARNNHIHKSPQLSYNHPLPNSLQSLPGSGTKASRDDHVHIGASIDDVLELASDANPTHPSAGADSGTSDTFSRGDHVHPGLGVLTASGRGHDVTANTHGTSGTSDRASRIDHAHSIIGAYDDTAKATDVRVQAASSGDNRSASRSDHVHGKSHPIFAQEHDTGSDSIGSVWVEFNSVDITPDYANQRFKVEAFMSVSRSGGSEDAKNVSIRIKRNDSTEISDSSNRPTAVTRRYATCSLYIGHIDSHSETGERTYYLEASHPSGGGPWNMSATFGHLLVYSLD